MYFLNIYMYNYLRDASMFFNLNIGSLIRLYNSAL